MRSKAPLLVLLALVVSPSLSQIPSSIATCSNPELNVLNGGGGSPCEVLHMVMSNEGIVITVPPLTLPQPYGPPSNEEFPMASLPMCTIEMYNLVQGCAACQQTTAVAQSLRYPTITDWNRRCTELGFNTNSVDLTGLNRTIPPWARLVPPDGDAFNLAAVMSFAESPFPAVTISTFTSPSSVQSPTASPVAVAEAVSVSPNIGAIVGGVVGGVVVLLLIGGVIFWVCRRQRSRSHTAPSAEFMNARHVPLAQDDEDDREMHAPMRHSSGPDVLPAFTPGQFKDPIFEKGVAISTGAMAMSSVGHSPVTSYSPATPSTAQQGPLRQSSGDQYQSSADAYQSSASHQYHSSVDQYRSSVDQYRTDVHPHSPHSPEMTQGYRD